MWLVKNKGFCPHLIPRPLHRHPDEETAHVDSSGSGCKKTNMKILLHISDKDYRELVSRGRRMRGSIGLIDTTEATFNRHHPEGRGRTPGYRFQKLAHGRVSITDERVRLTLNIERTETNVCASECIDAESRTASDFVFEEIEEVL